MKQIRSDSILKQAILFEKLAQETIPEVPKENSQIFYRAQPKGKDLFGHTSGLAYEKVQGIFAFEEPDKIFDTYSWVHMRKNIDNFEMIKFLGKLIDKPIDSEGVVVEPEKIIDKTPLRDFIQQFNVS